jgi:hypothetical protein
MHDRSQRVLNRTLDALRYLFEHVTEFVKPAALLLRTWKDFSERRPNAGVAVGNE